MIDDIRSGPQLSPPVVHPRELDKPEPHDHVVRFYEDDEALHPVVADFLLEGFQTGAPAIVIATESHRHGFIEQLASRGVDVGHLQSTAQLTMLDARETLDRFMAGELPDRALFMKHVGGPLAKLEARAKGSSSRVRAYGEMVDLLWTAGQGQAAIDLEELWNDLAREHSFSLLCAYSMGGFYREGHSAAFDRICSAHSHVHPTEKHAPQDSEASRREIARLQQRAQALEREIEQRKELEVALREALTERRRAESALRTNQLELEDFFENAPVGLHWVDGDGMILRANQAELDLLGLTAEEYVGHHISEFHADRETIEDMLARLAQGQTLHDREARLRCKDGTLRDVLVSSNVLWKDGKFVHTRCFTRDVTDRRVMETALRTSESRFRLMAQMLPSIVWTTDPDGATTYVNERWAQHTGFTGMESPEQAREVIHPDDRGPFLDAWDAARASGTEFEFELRIRRSDGEYRWFVTRATAIRDAAGRVTAWLGVSTDIHETKELQSALREADRRKDEFLAMLAHELRNPLAPIVTVTQLLRFRLGHRDEVRSHVDLLERQTHHLTKLIDDLLEVSRITRGKIRLEKEWLDMSVVISRAVEISRPLIDSRKQELAVLLPDEPLWVHADATRLAQVLGNVLNNAAKYTDIGGRIWISAALEDSQAVVRVRDNGIGITRELMPRLFELFAQADNTLDRAQGGLGIGLTLVRGLVELHGGTVEAQSAGHCLGSEFTVRLPVPAGPHERPEPRSADQLASTPPCRIVIVDDNRDAASSLAELLGVSGHQVNVAHDGVSTMELVRAQKPDVVLLDIGLPRMDGYEVAEALRREHGDQLILVALTGYGQHEDRRRTSSVGFDHHLVKPVDLRLLSNVLATVVGKRR